MSCFLKSAAKCVVRFEERRTLRRLSLALDQSDAGIAGRSRCTRTLAMICWMFVHSEYLPEAPARRGRTTATELQVREWT